MSPPPRSLAPRIALLQDQRYRLRFLREDGRQTAIVMAVVAGGYVATAINDFSLFRADSPALIASLATRGLLLAIAGFALLVARRAKWPQQQDRAFNLAHLGTAIAISVSNLLRVPNGPLINPFLGTLCVIVFLYFAERGPIVPRTLVASAATGSILTLMFLIKGPAAIDRRAQVASVAALLGLNAVGFFSARSFEEQRRKRFDAERRERHARQELAAKLRELAIEKDRAETMSRARTAFLAAMSHEFRTPMNAVIGLSDVLLDEPLAPTHRGHVRIINDSARALLALLNDILDFTKIDAQKLSLSPAPFDLRKVAASVIDMLGPQARNRSIELTLDLAPDVPEHLLGDGARLRQVLVNLGARTA